MRYKNILVTGGAGFIGSFLVDKLIKLGHQVTIFDNLEHQVHQGKKPKYLNQAARFIKGDVRDYSALKKALKNIAVVFHEAAAVGVAQSNYEIKRYSDVNVGGTANLLDIIVNDKRTSIKKIITTSSMTAYGEGRYRCVTHGSVEPDLRSDQQIAGKDWNIYCPECRKSVSPIPTPENAGQPGSSIYALTKKTQEDMLILLGKMYQIPTVALRCFNVYGPRQSLSNPYTGVTAIFISRLKNNKAPVIYEDGQQTRDFVSVHDVVDALILAMNSKVADYQIFNIASGKATSIQEVAQILSQLMNSNLKPKIAEKGRKNDIRHCFADIHQAKQILKWQPKVSLKQGMKELINWSLKQESTDAFAQASQELKEKGII